MRADDIRNKEALDKWLGERPESSLRRDSIIVSHRAACRVFPLIPVHHIAPTRADTILSLLRALLTSAVAAAKQSDQVLLAATRAHRADMPKASAAAFMSAFAVISSDPAAAAVRCVDMSASDAASLTSSLAGSMRGAYAGSDAIWDMCRWDASNLEQLGNPLETELWPDEAPSWFLQLDTRLREYWNENNSLNWSFWVRWWDGVLSGQQVDWRIQEEVADIYQEVWETGSGAVAGAIRKIEGRYREDQTPNGETIFINEEGLFDRKPDAARREGTLKSVVGSVERIVSRIRVKIAEDHGNCLYTQLSDHLLALETALVACRHDARGLHDELGAVWRNIGAMVRAKELPANDLLIDTLERVLDDGQIDLRREYDHVARAHKSRTTTRIRRFEGEAKALVEKLAPAVAEISTPQLGSEMVRDAADGVNPKLDEETQDVARYRFTSRLVRFFNRLTKRGLDAAAATEKLNKGVDAGIALGDKAEDAARVIAESGSALLDKIL